MGLDPHPNPNPNPNPHQGERLQGHLTRAAALRRQPAAARLRALRLGVRARVGGGGAGSGSGRARLPVVAVAAHEVLAAIVDVAARRARTQPDHLRAAAAPRGVGVRARARALDAEVRLLPEARSVALHPEHLGGVITTARGARPRLVRVPRTYSAWRPGGKRPCASGAYSTRKAGTRSGGRGACVSAQGEDPLRLARWRHQPQPLTCGEW